MSKTPAQLKREIEAFLQKSARIRRQMPRLSNHNTPQEIEARKSALARIKKLDEQVLRRRPAPPAYPTGTGIWRILDD